MYRDHHVTKILLFPVGLDTAAVRLLDQRGALNLSAEELHQELVEALGIFHLDPMAALTVDMELHVR